MLVLKNERLYVFVYLHPPKVQLNNQNKTQPLELALIWQHFYMPGAKQEWLVCLRLLQSM